MSLASRRPLRLLLRTVIALAVLEGLLRLAAAFGLLALPAGGLGGLDLALHGRNAGEQVRLLVPDRHLIQRMRANVDLEYPRTLQLDDRPRRYAVRTSPQGFRGPPIGAKPAGVFRILCLGDSSTFGFNVEAADAYPAVLQRLLEARHPGRFEVVNLGVPGWTSRQGLELLRRQALAFEPDLVTFGFGTNDRFFPAPMTDDAVMRFQDSPTGATLFVVRAGLDRLYVYRLVKRLVGALLARPTASGGSERRVPLDGIAAAVVEAQELAAARGAELLLINQDFTGTDAVEGLRDGAARARVPLLDMQAALLAARQARGEALAAALDLPPANAAAGTILFRVHAPGRREVAVAVERLLRPVERLALRDDGGGADQVAGDGVWSGTLAATPGEMFFYTYHAAGGSEFPHPGPLPMTRIQFVPADGVAALDVFADPFFYADSSHVDEAGHHLIAERLAAAVLATPAVRAFLDSR